MVQVGDHNVKLKGARIAGKSEYDKASWLSKLTFFWIVPIIVTGNAKKLTYEDLHEYCAADDPKKCTEHLQRQWEKPGKSSKSSRDRNFGWTLFKTYIPYIVLLSMPLFFTEVVLRVGQALAVGYLTRYFTDSSSLTLREAYYCVFVLIFSVATFSIARSFFYQQVMREGYKMKNSVEGLLYKKILRMSASSNSISVGQILNMMATDTDAFMLLPVFMNYFYIAPIQAAICMVILWYYIQAAVITGIVLLLLLIPLQSVISAYFEKFRSYLNNSTSSESELTFLFNRRQTTAYTDKRINLLKEIIGAMQVIKLYCWEKPFSDEVSGVRRAEMSKIRKKAYLSGVNEAINFCGTRLILFFTLATHVLAGGKLDAETVFVTMSLFNLLTISVVVYLPFAFSSLAEAKVASKRIQAFLSLDEQSSTQVNNRLTRGQVVLNQFSAKWDSRAENLALSDLTYRTESGKLVLVVGPVGSGKSCLLHALLNDIFVVSGSCGIGGTVSYCPQEPWCFGGTIKENILFGSAYDENWFKTVLDVCGLQRDLKLLPDKAQTIVGEKGYCLSGGQKARVTLARAIYRDADIYLLDDPLSAVDPAVANHIFQNCIKGILKTKTVILVTHQLQFLDKADDIILLDKGEHITKEKYEKRIISGVMDFLPYIGHKTGSISESESPESEYEREEIAMKSDSDAKVDDETSQSSLSLSSVFWAYFRSGSSLIVVLSLIITTLASQFLYNYNDWWLAEWSDDFESYQTNFTNIPLQGEADNLITYTSLTVLLLALTFVRTVGTSVLCLNSSINLHNTIFRKLLLTKMAFFETNPVGRILNRFTRDMGFVDQRMPKSLNLVILGLSRSIGAILVAAAVSPYLMLPALFLPVVAISLQRVYVRSVVPLTRLEAITISPVYNHITSTFDGLSTIRAFGMESIFEKQYFNYMNDVQSTRYISKSISRAFGFFLEISTVTYVSFVALFLVLFPDGIPGGLAGLALSSSLVLSGVFQFTIRETIELQMQMVSVERILEYGKLPVEEESFTEASNAAFGQTYRETSCSVTYKDVSLTYGDKKVLDSVNFKVKGGEKIGIVGRTGAGKSSLIAALFRLADYDGSILLDGKDTKRFQLEEVRSSLSIIPQDPVLFGGSLRRNLDPFNDFEEAWIWKCLGQAKLDQFVRDLPNGLYSEIAECGNNLSVGERQLVCLTRALMRNSKLLVLDEATANVDHQTDQLIQRTIKDQFQHCTVLTVAHRLNTIIDMDKVLVMDAGQVKEYDEPHQLLQNKGLFYDMVMQTGNEMASALLEAARRASLVRQRATCLCSAGIGMCSMPHL
ncbi:ATP-binding cassette sub-family C member 4 [Halotydeus destructor]|nr:ATP-binding cassette sub-family C member 4 [Halotydeus destructor]